MTGARHRLPPAVIALLLQIVGFACALLTISLSGLHITALLFALLCGSYAAIFSHIASLARWWLLIQFTFAPLLVLTLSLNLPPAFFLAGFVILLTVYWTTFRTQVPLYLSSNRVWRTLAEHLPANRPINFIDLGSGLGGVLTYLGKVHPQGAYLGVETAPVPFLWSWLRIKLGGHRNCAVRWASLWQQDLSQYDVVFAYLSPVPMPALWEKARREMRPGSLFISNSFAVPDQSPHEVLPVKDLHDSRLFLWRF